MRFSTLAAIAAVLAAPGLAWAGNPLPAATGYAFVGVNPAPYPEVFNTITAPFTFGDLDAGGNGVTLSASGINGPSVFAQADSGEASLMYTWSYEVNGPSGQTVNLNLTGGLTAQGHPDGPIYLGEALATVTGTAATVIPTSIYDEGIKVNAEDCVGDNCTNVVNTNGAFSIELAVPTDTVETLTIAAYADSWGNNSGPFLAQADPILTLAPGTANPGAYSIGVSDGVSNGPTNPGVPDSVPEPAAWALMILGVGATGATLRAQRRAAANA